MEMMLGASTDNFSGDTLIKKYRSIAKHGFRYINVHLDKDYSRKQIISSIKTFKQLNLYCGQISSAKFPYLYNNIVNVNKAIELGKNLCDMQKLFGGKQIAINPGIFIDDKRECMRSSTRIIQEICDYASKYGMIVALTIVVEDDQLISSWSDIRKYFAKVDRQNLMINLDTKFLNMTKPDMRALSPFSESIAQFQINDCSFDLDNNTDETTIHLKKWADKILPFVKDSVKEYGDTPTSVLLLKNTITKEVQYSLDYLAITFPEMQL